MNEKTPSSHSGVEQSRSSLAAEWAYAKPSSSDEARSAAYPAWLHADNRHRRHTGIGGSTPADRDRNLTRDDN